jgi:hypothetical protein
MQEAKYKRYPQKCFYCPATAWGSGLEEHHLWRGSERRFSPSVFLCHRCHEKATFNKEFEIKLQEIYLYQYDRGQIDHESVAGYGADKYNPKGYGHDRQDSA